MDDKPDDHARGCEGRQYTCTCGYDDRIATALEAQAAEIARLKARLNWLANETMACDYGDNDHGAVAWRFHKYNGAKVAIIGGSIDAAIDAAREAINDPKVTS